MNSCLQESPPAPTQLEALQAINTAGGTEYPSLYRRLYTGWKQGYKLQTVIEMIASINKPILKDGKYYVSLAIRQIHAKHGSGGLDTWQKYLKAFVSWGLLEQYKPHARKGITKEERKALQYAKIQAKKFHLSGSYVNPTRWYHLPEYTPVLLLEADRKASEYIPSKSKADWIVNAGKEEADRIFHDKRGISEERKVAQEAIEAALTACIHSNGYATDETLIAATEATTGLTRRYITDTLRGIRRDLIERYNLKWCRPSKEQVEAYSLKGYGYIYLKVK